jgi:hypothetical protein
LDLGAQNLTDAPVDVTSVVLPPQPAPTPRMLTCTFGTDADDANPEWHLTVENTDIGGGAAALATNRSVIAVMSAISAATPTVRMHRRDNINPMTDDNDVRVHVPVQFDLRSLQDLAAYKYYIALANRGSGRDCYLLDIVATPEAL